MKARRLPIYYTFGKEFEVTGGLSSDEMKLIVEELIKKGILRSGWEVHYDSSVIDENGLGYEIVSPPLSDDKKTEEEIKYVLELIKLHGGIATESSSSHTHFGLQCWGKDEFGVSVSDEELVKIIQRYLKLYYVFEPEMIKLTSGDLGIVRQRLYKYATPQQNRLINIIEGKFENISEFMMCLEACIGANATYYGPYRYFSLNIQRLVEAIRNLPDNCNKTETLEKVFQGVEIIGKTGKKLSPTIECREAGTTFDYNRLMFEIRLHGNLIQIAHDSSIDTMLNELYEKEKQRKSVVLDKVLPSERERYPDLTDDEILMNKFNDSIYRDGVLDFEKVYSLFDIIFPGITTYEIDKILENLPIVFNADSFQKNKIKRLAA